jgi:hypothetical protein
LGVLTNKPTAAPWAIFFRASGAENCASKTEAKARFKEIKRLLLAI